MGLKVVGILLEGEKYEPATNLLQRLACTPIEPRARRKIERGLEGRDRSEARGGGRRRRFVPPVRTPFSLCSLKN